jgi:rhodanese-related sulfurtransferase
VLSSRLIPRIARPWKTAFGQTAALALLAAVLGLIVNQVRSDSIPVLGDWSPEARITLKFGKNILIPFEEAKDKFLTGAAVFIDARTPELYQEGHIQGALNLPIAEFDQMADKVLMDFPENALIVTYCDGEDCTLSAELALKLKEIGYENVRVLHNGWSVWESHHLPSQGVKEQEG